MFKNTFKIIIVVILLLIVAFGVLFYYSYSQISISNVNPLIRQRLIFAKEEKDYVYQKLNVNANEKIEIVPLASNFKNLLKPIYTVVHSQFIAPDKSIKSVQVYIFKIIRDNFLSTKLNVPESAYRGLIVNKSFDEVVNLVNEKDLSIDKIEGLNLSINPPLTPSQITETQIQRKQIEKDIAEGTKPMFRKRRFEIDCYERNKFIGQISPEQFQVCLDEYNTSDLKKELEEEFFN